MSVRQQLHQQELQLCPQELAEIASHSLLVAKQAQIAIGQQPRPAKLPPLVPEFSQILVCRVSTRASGKHSTRFALKAVKALSSCS